MHDSIHESLLMYNLLRNASLLNINSNKLHQYFHDFLAACFELLVTQKRLAPFDGREYIAAW